MLVSQALEIKTKQLSFFTFLQWGHWNHDHLTRYCTVLFLRHLSDFIPGKEHGHRCPSLSYSPLSFPLWFPNRPRSQKRGGGVLGTCHSPFLTACSESLPGLNSYLSGPGTYIRLLYFTLVGPPLIQCCPLPTTEDVWGWSLGGIHSVAIKTFIHHTKNVFYNKYIF